MSDDVVKAIRICDSIAELLLELRECTTGLVDIESDEHPVKEVSLIMFGMQNALLATYGRTMFNAPDGVNDADEWLKWVEDRARSVNKSHSEDNFSAMSEGILSAIRRKTGEDGDTDTPEDGVSVQ